MLRLVDELTYLLSPIPCTPDDVRPFKRDKVRAVPVRVKARGYFSNLVSMACDHGVVAGLSKVSRLPVERLDIRRLTVHYHRLLMRHVETWIAVLHRDGSCLQPLASLSILLLAVPSLRVQHHAHIHAAFSCRNYRFQQRWVRENKHLDPQRRFRAINGVDEGLGRIIR